VLLLATKVGPWARVMRAGDRRLSGGARGRGVQRGTVQTGGGWSGARRGPRGTRTFEGVWEQDHDPRLMPATWPPRPSTSGPEGGSTTELPGAGQHARVRSRVPGRMEHSVNPSLTGSNSKILNKSSKSPKIEIVDGSIGYNFYKG
jgi:hypothetical protein